MRRAAIALAAVALGLVAAPVAPARAAPQLSVIEDDASLLRAGSVVRERTLDDMAALGAEVVRILVLWRDTPAEWPALDAAVAGARARGLDVVLTLTGPGPRAVSGCVPRDGACRPDPVAFGRFVAEAAARYRSVHRWSLWNEPNVPSWLRPQRVVRDGRTVLASPALYRALARAGAAALAAADGHAGDDVLVGETAPVGTLTTGPAAWRPTPPLVFARALLAARVPGTGWAHHAYSAGGVRDPAAPWKRDALGPTSLGALGRELSRAAARGTTARRFGIWLTEAGFQTNPPDPFFGVAPAVQAAWMNELDWMMAARPAVRSVAQYLVVDEPVRSSFQSGLRWVDGRRKPAWGAYRAPLWVAARSGGEVAVWGGVRPRGGVLVGLERRGAGTSRWTRVVALRGRVVRRRVAAGPRGAAWRLVWRDGAGRRFVSRAAHAVGVPSAR
jgi:hypothetical protein